MTATGITDLATELLGAAHVADEVAKTLATWWTKIGAPIAFTIEGQPCSKANSRKIVTLARGKPGERTAVVKSAEALAYERLALWQIPSSARVRLEGPVAVTMTIYYATERPDLDESLILDVLQDRFAPAHGAPGKRELVQAGVYRNDRQVREKHVYHGIDRRRPRCEISVQPMIAQQTQLL